MVGEGIHTKEVLDDGLRVGRMVVLMSAANI